MGYSFIIIFDRVHFINGRIEGEVKMNFKIAENVTRIDMGNELLLTNADKKVVSLQLTSKKIFELVEQRYCINEIIDEFKKIYLVDIEDNQLEEDVLECLDSLVENKILVRN